jgi:hypothetical protein
MKICITISNNFEELFCNGLKYNVFLWYNFLELCGYDVYLLCGDYESEYKEYSINIVNHNYNIIRYNINNLQTLKETNFYQDLHSLLCIGFRDNNLIKVMKIDNKKTIYVMLGNQYQYHIQNIIDKDFLTYSDAINIFNEIWISPHFEYSKDYLECIYNTKVVVCPYIWEPFLLQDSMNSNTIKPIENTIDVAIMEPNLNYGKTCLIPISICELNEKDINNVYVFGAHHLKENKFVQEVIMKKEIIKKGKASFEHRVPITDIVSKYCNVVISCNENWDLNYVFLECFYLGVPLVHNSEFLKDYGYYYPNLRINKTLGMFEDIKKKFNKTDYIEKHKEVLFKYSIYNPMNQAWVKHKLG